MPIAIDTFFKRSGRKLFKLHRPSWLLSELADKIWNIDSGINAREVKGVLKGYKRIHWSKRLSAGSFTDPCYALALEQSKLIIVWAFDGAIPRFDGSLKTITGFYSFLFRVIEFLDFRYPDAFRNSGFGILDAEDVVDMLELAMESGICGTGFFIERWNRYLCEKVGRDASYQQIMVFLSSSNAFDLKGNVSSTFVGTAIGADAHRLATSQKFKEYLSIYSLKGQMEPVAPIQIKTVSQLSTWFRSLAQVLSASPIDSSLDFDDPYLFSETLKAFSSPPTGRTRTLPSSLARSAISGCLNWMSVIYPCLESYTRQVLLRAKMYRTVSPELPEYNAIRLAENSIELPLSLTPLKEVFFSCEGLGLSEHPLAPPVTIKLIQMQVAVSFVVVTLLSCSRRSEVLELSIDSIHEQNGYRYLDVNLRKTGIDNQRRILSKPVPPVVGEAIDQAASMKELLLELYESSDNLFYSRIFFRVSQMGVGPMTSSDIYIPLRELSKCFGLKDSGGNDWVVLPHQLRRYFAMSFFHHDGQENSLPALSWFMGHEDVVGTWRYIRESLTGREVSASEASMAAFAVCSEDSSEGARRLREILYKHFNCDNISLMNEEDIQDYLELLSEKGIYTATPVQIRQGKHRQVSVLIVIREAIDATAT